MLCEAAPGSSLRDRLPAPGGDVNGAGAAIAAFANRGFGLSPRIWATTPGREGRI